MIQEMKGSIKNEQNNNKIYANKILELERKIENEK